ncbi:peptidase M24, structural domain-containing protein [Podospora didyma]|uniref:Methionine aminopeptidase n=1 Tax=Podospora didyma TaxID=330526 RepID=A0AAE0NFZ8_9PEZI|nr:peptidase M24, structural domain-containing protein [Podospora didyma]
MPMERSCSGSNCPNPVGSLQCPTCLKLNIEGSYFCSQDCFKANWAEHKTIHQVVQSSGTFNPFPTFNFTGPLRPVYPLSSRRTIPKSISAPEWSEDGTPKYPPGMRSRNWRITILDAQAQDKMRTVCRLTREVLDLAAAAVRPGITTDELDQIVHQAAIERNAYPSPLNYNHFPKSFCTSVNEVICHGIPDQRVLLDGDIINLDVSLYYDGHHGDVNETYYVGDRAITDPDSVRVVEAARVCLDEAIKMVKPGVLFREFGNIIEKKAKDRGCNVVRTYCGHGINHLFHCPPDVLHYARNKGVGVVKSGMAFTIEPMVTLGSHKDVTWPDRWTATTADGRRTAQFEHTLLVTDDGVEVLTAKKADSPGGPVSMPHGG